jgi:hypothetical protein
MLCLSPWNNSQERKQQNTETGGKHETETDYK